MSYFKNTSNLRISDFKIDTVYVNVGLLKLNRLEINTLYLLH